MTSGGRSTRIRATPQVMHVGPDADDLEWAQLRGGPCDGRVDPVEPDAAELVVIMSDGQHHRYRRCPDGRDTEGRKVVVFEWDGRRFGPA